MDMIRPIIGLLRAFFVPRTALAAENLALRQRISVLQRSVIVRAQRRGQKKRRCR